MAVLAQFWGASAWANCWLEVGARYAIEPELLYAIAQVESRLKSDVINHNRDGSIDVGLMQINSQHLPRLKARGITQQRLLDEPCLAIDVGASILAGFIARHGYNWTAVGAYNAGSSPDRQALRMRYAQKVYRRYHALLVNGPLNHQI
ncbi:transglycosylase SLT domain-containing protein [Pseudomonas chlororaphis subsp. aurantiaca]|uniref:transglycosylase SLT domain-containing protein n=1 Tax=Pseudomonas chlororaphis TaxID=587753 RepID=UPI0027DE5730|nr:transglycosylase SLT domain-containing protein [Pseudomonas chlororaphis]WMI97546.1 transglycosylase SLT domain-containing protein [Pseudomonas chlororaphis subsp. aurantiaca]